MIMVEFCVDLLRGCARHGEMLGVIDGLAAQYALGERLACSGDLTTVAGALVRPCP